MELLSGGKPFLFSDRVQKFVQKLSKTPGFSEIEPEELYLEKLNNGLYTLERVALIIAEVCVNGDAGCRERAAKLFRMKLKNPSISAHLDPVLLPSLCAAHNHH